MNKRPTKTPIQIFANARFSLRPLRDLREYFLFDAKLARDAEYEQGSLLYEIGRFGKGTNPEGRFKWGKCRGFYLGSDAASAFMASVCDSERR